MLIDRQAAATKIASGAALLLAGQERLLAELPRGNWIAGTIPYFMDASGGVISEDKVFVTELPRDLALRDIRSYRVGELARVVGDAPDDGLTALIIPAGSDVHRTYASEAPSYPGAFMKPVVGWIAGIHLRDLGTATPKVFDGRTGEAFSDRAVAMHVALPPGKVAAIRTINLFEQGPGDTLTFPEDGFVVTDCFVNGARTNFASYLGDHAIDTKLPLVADYSGTKVNVSVQAVDATAGKVTLYAPVFQGMEYKVAAPVADYVASFDAVVPRGLAAPVFACNCILNFLYSELEGKSTGAITGPITFGEIADQLMNQTLVYVQLEG